MAKTNWFVTNKLRNYFKEKQLKQPLTNRQQLVACNETGVTSIQLVEFMLYGEVTFKERKQVHE